jgi:hypothetical protein
MTLSLRSGLRNRRLGGLSVAVRSSSAGVPFDGIEADGHADAVGLADDAAHGGFGVSGCVVVRVEVAVGLGLRDHVPGCGDDGVLHRN